jgi:GT2 family glycosyltransferase
VVLFRIRDTRVSSGTPRVCVVIPSWNGLALLKDVCLPSLARQTFRDFSVLVVDNGSSDGSLGYLSTAWPAVTVLRVERNRGFAVAVNTGIASCDSEFTALVNNDVELDAHWLECLVDALERQESAASATGKTLDFHNRAMIGSAGDAMTLDGGFYGRGSGEPDVGQYDVPGPVFSATAGAALYRRSAFEVVGVFDEDFFAYAEDVDWGFRAQLAGFTCCYVPSAIAYHIGAATSSRIAGARTFLMIRNSVWLITKDVPGPILVRTAPRILLALCLRSYRATRTIGKKQIMIAWFQALMGMRRMSEKRRAIQRSRRVDDVYLLRIMESRELSPKLARLKRRILPSVRQMHSSRPRPPRVP